MWGFDRVGVVSVCNEGALSSGRVGNVCSGVCVSVCVCVCVCRLTSAGLSSWDTIQFLKFN